MRGRDDQVLDHVLGARGHADAALAAARLPPVGIDRGALQVSAARHRHRDVLHLHQVFEADLAGVFDDLRAALVAEVLLDFLQLLDDHAAQNFFRAQDLQIFRDLLLDLGQLVDDLLLLHAGEALELQFDNRLRLFLGELEAGDQAVAGFPRSLGGADQRDHRVQIVERLLESQQQMLAVASLAQKVIRAPAHHVQAVIDEALDGVEQAQLARLPVDDGQQDHAEVDLHLRVLVQIVQHHFGLLAALQLEHDAHAVAVALVADFRDALRASSRSPGRRRAQ